MSNPERRSCCIEGCRAQILRPKVACPKHWGLLPEQLQQVIGQAVLEDDTDSLSTSILAARQYMDRYRARWGQ